LVVKVEIQMVAIGSELISGLVQDTNTQWVATQLQANGYKLSSSRIIGDNRDELIRVFREAEEKGGIYIITGGLGPTKDDITRFSAAGAFNLPLVGDEKRLEFLREKFAARGIDMPFSNEVQTEFPKGAQVIDNPVGTAAGFMIKRQKATLIFLPGVPRELCSMFKEVMPMIKEIAPRESVLSSRTLRVFGLTEARVGEIISGGIPGLEGVSISYLPRFPEINLVFSASGKDMPQVEERLDKAEALATDLLKEHIYSRGDNSIEEVVGRLLVEKRESLSVAESCTGGLIANLLTNVPGSSQYFDCGVVSYSNESKSALLNVPEEMIRDHGAVSEQVARAMARGVRSIKESDFGIGVTGIAGPEGGSDEKPVGTVFIALNWGEDDYCSSFLFPWDRLHNKIVIATCALDILRRKLLGFDLYSFV
jgi:nicotinamide-nucleotide amidase